MSRHLIQKILLIVMLLLTAACGTIARPVWETAEPEADHGAAEGQAETEVEAAEEEVSTEVAELPTATLVPPTATPIPPTLTEIPPTPTEEPAAPPAALPNDPIITQVRFSNATNGETLFNTTIEVSGVAWACSTCHSIVKDERKVGPSQYGLPQRALTRVEGVVAERYIYNSIINPNEYIVPEYVENVMPQGYSEVFSEAQIFDIVAYLMTLNEE